VPELELSVVLPVFNEAEGIARFLVDLRVTLDSLHVPYEIIVVDDGSTDQTVKEVLASDWPAVRLVLLNRNVGHQTALDAGTDCAAGRWIVTMDGDGQHPPESLPHMYEAALNQHVDVVYAISDSRVGQSRAKRFFALNYYRMMRFLSDSDIEDSQADFRLISRRVADEVRGVKGDRVMRLLLPTMGYASCIVPYTMRERIAGRGRFGVGRQFRLTWTSIVGFSAKPLKLMALLALSVTAAALFWIAYVLLTFLLGNVLPGWTSVITAVLILGSFLLLGQAMLGFYVAALFDMTKGNPRYSIRRIIGARDD